MGAYEFTGAEEIRFHSADSNNDFAITLTELLRAVQFFNSGGYHCVFGTEDGFAPGPGDCPPDTAHDADYNPRDFTVNLLELLRIVQFFNAPGGYIEDPAGEDGFRPIFEFPTPE